MWVQSFMRKQQQEQYTSPSMAVNHMKGGEKKRIIFAHVLAAHSWCIVSQFSNNG